MMSQHNGTSHEASEIELLLPWYVTGALSADEKADVESHLARHPEAAAQLSLIAEEREATIEANEALDAVSAGALDRLLNQIEAEDGPAIERAARPGLLERLTDWLPGLATPQARFGAVGAVAIIAVQAIVIGMLSTGSDRIETASRPGIEAVASGPRLVVSFTEAASLGEITKLLGEIEAVIVGGPKPGGLYVIELSRDKKEGEIDAVIAGLKGREGLIAFVGRSN